MPTHNDDVQSAPAKKTLSAWHAALALIAVLLAVAWLVPLRSGGLTVTFTRGGPLLESPNGSSVELAPGSTVTQGDRLIVPGDGAINLQSPDGHNLTVADSTTVVVTSSRHTLLGGKTATEVQVVAGGLRVSGDARPRTSLDIGLPNGVAGVRGTAFDVEVAGDQTLLSVHEGNVGISSATGETVDLSPGEGVILTAAGPTVMALPGTPGLLSPADGSVVDTAGTQVTWSAVTGAATYVIDMAADADFLQIMATTTSIATSVVVPALEEDMPVFVRVSAVSAEGLRSEPSAARTLQVRLRLALGQQRLAGGDIDQSIAEFQAAIPNYPDDVQLLRDLGWSLYLADRYEEARDAYERAVALEPDDVDTLLEIARVYALLGDYTQAESTYQTVLADAPDDPDALWGLGDTYRLMGRLDEALDLVQRALRLQPDHPYARETLRQIRDEG